MSNQEDPILFLLCKRTLGKALLPDEQAELSNWFIQYREQLFSFEVQPAYLAELEAFEQDTDESWERFKIKYHHELFPPDKIKIPVLLRRYARLFKIAATAAAVIFIAYLLIPYLYRQYKPRIMPAKQVAVLTDIIVTDSFKAVLTLADSSRIALDAAQTGIIAQQGGSAINKLSNGFLRYEKGNGPADTSICRNTLATPKGGRYQLVLPDGTTVTLNDTSVLSYPSVFTGPERVVELSGEAYFEVAKNTLMPFKVKLNRNSEVKALGTHFNVNAYNDDRVYTTTLLEGAVKITANKSSMILKPGQEAFIDEKETLALADTPHIDRAIAWKNGIFDFKNVNFDVAMRQLARWYNVDLVYLEPIENKELLSINIPRTSGLKSILNSLQKIMPFHYSIEGRNLILRN